MLYRELRYKRNSEINTAWPRFIQNSQWRWHKKITRLYDFNEFQWTRQEAVKKKIQRLFENAAWGKTSFHDLIQSIPRYNHRRVVEGACVRISSQNRSNTSVSVRNRKLDFFAKKQFQYFWNCGKRSLMEQGKNDRPLNKIARKLCLRRSFFYNRYF